MVNEYCSHGISRITGSSDHWLGGTFSKGDKAVDSDREGSSVLFQDECETKRAVRAFPPQRPSPHPSTSHFGKGRQG